MAALRRLPRPLILYVAATLLLVATPVLSAPSPPPAAAFVSSRSSPPQQHVAVAALSARQHVSDDTAAELSRDRRSFLVGGIGAAASISLLLPLPALADDDATAAAPAAPLTAEPYTQQGKDFAYALVPPPGFAPGNKPLKTHLDEVNFSVEGVRGYQYGITVDPVRIDSLRQFGTPEEVAARVVTAEVNRDGVFDVTLSKDPVEDAASGSYVFEYISNGKRGKKRFVTKIYIRNQKLYVLTAQSKEDEYTAEREREMAEAVGTFRLL